MFKEISAHSKDLGKMNVQDNILHMGESMNPIK